MADDDPWPAWIRQHQKELAERSYGHELAFVERVLRRVPEIDPLWVTHEFPFQDASGRNRRVDFVLEHWSLHRPIAIEVDGRDKTGKPASKAEHNDFFERQNALTALDFRLLRFTNSQVAGNPVKLRREISEAIGVEQLSAQRLRASQPEQPSAEVASEQPGLFVAPPHLPPTTAPAPNRAEHESMSAHPEAPPGRSPTTWVLLASAVAVGAVVLFASVGGTSDPAAGPSSDAAELGTAPVAPFTCPSAAPVKGNDSQSSGELIYHPPDGQFYEQTNPVRCFASETEAEAAGFRASQR
jgi:very-short-patch-repair endonuclease